MESTALPPQENGDAAPPPGAPEDPASSDDSEGFETASDPDVDSDAGGDQSPSRGGESGILKGVSVGNPDQQGDSEIRVAGAEEKEPPVVASADRDASGEESSIFHESVEENGVHDAGGEKAEGLGDGGCEAEGSPVVHGVAENGVDRVGENGAPDAGGDKEENLGDGKSEAAAIPVVDGAAAENVVGAEDNGITDAGGKKEDNSGEGESEAEASPVVDAVENVLVGVEENGVPDAGDRKEEDLGDGESEASASPVVGGAAGNIVGGVEENWVTGAGDKKEDGMGDGESESATSPGVDGATENIVGGPEENGVTGAGGKKEDGMGDGESESAASPIVDGATENVVGGPEQNWVTGAGGKKEEDVGDGPEQNWVTGAGGKKEEDVGDGESESAASPVVDGAVENVVGGPEENGVIGAGGKKEEDVGDAESESAASPVVDGAMKNVVCGPEENGVTGAGGMKEEDLSDGESEAAARPVVDGAAENEENEVPDAEGKKEENLGVAESKAAASPVVNGLASSDPVVVESGVAGAADTAEKNEAPDAPVEENENSIKGAEILEPVEEGLEAARVVAEVDHGAAPIGSEEVSSSVMEGSADSKIFEDEPVTGDAWKDESADRAGSNQELGWAAESKPVYVEVENDGDIYTAASRQTLEGEAKSLLVQAESSTDAEKTGLDDGAGSKQSIKENVEDSADKLYIGNESEAVIATEVVYKCEGSSVDCESADSELAKDPAEKYDVMNGGEAVNGVTDMKHETGDKKVEPESRKLISVQDGESPPITTKESQSRETKPVSVSEREEKPDAVGAAAAAAGEKMGMYEAEEEDEDSGFEGPARLAILESSETAKQIIMEMEEGSTSSSYHSGFRSSGESYHLDGQIVSDSEEEVGTDEEGEGKELFDSATLTALLKAATGASSDGGITITSQDATRIFSVNRPAGLGSSVPSLNPAPSRSSRPTPVTPSNLTVVGEPENNIDEEEKKLEEKVEQIRVKFLRLVQRLGHSPEDTVAAQVLYRLGLAEGIRHGRQISRLFSIENAKRKAMKLEEVKEDLEFSCNILVLGKTGVGKSATINSIFGEGKSRTNPFEPATTSVREISGIVDGVKIHVLDTPGLRASVMDQAANRKILLAIKKHTKRCPPDIVLYVDRMDTQTRDFNDLPLLRSITSTLGSSIWFNAIVALTHAASAPPDGPNGSPLSYEVFIAQRSHVVQHSIRQAAGDMRLMNPVALVENHPSCRRNREGERVLPNGLSWRPQLLLLCYSSKILSEANALLKLQDPSPGKLFGFRARSPSLPHLLSSLLQSRPHPKLSADQGGDNGDSDIDLDGLSDIDQEEEDDEYDQLPPFKPLRKSQIAKLTKEQKRSYFDEYDYRVKLLQKKQWKEELKRLKEMRKKGKSQQDDLPYGDMAEDFNQDGAPADVQVPLPDMALPPSFDCDNPVHRYRSMEPTSQSQLRIMPIMYSHGWDHDCCGWDGIRIEESLAIASRFPAGLSVQVTKDKKEFNIHLDSSIAAKHGENGSTLTGFDIQTIGKQLAYVLRGETKFKNLKKNKTAAGISMTFLGETVSTGLKIEDQLPIGKRVELVASTGVVRAQGDTAYGANLEARLRDKDYPIGQALTTLGLTMMTWRSDLALGANLQSQFSIGRSSKMAIRVGLNNKHTGQITVRTSTSEQLQIALVGILPLAVTLFRRFVAGESYMGQ